MAQYQLKSGGPTRGRRRVKRIGMGSGRMVVEAQKAKKKGKRGSGPKRAPSRDIGR